MRIYNKTALRLLIGKYLINVISLKNKTLNYWVFNKKDYICRRKMKIIKKHIIFSLLFVAILTLVANVDDNHTTRKIVGENEIEEILNEVDVAQQFLKSDKNFNDGGNQLFISNNVIENNYNTKYFFELGFNSKKIVLQLPLFILYSCLKIDC